MELENRLAAIQFVRVVGEAGEIIASNGALTSENANNLVDDLKELNADLEAKVVSLQGTEANFIHIENPDLFEELFPNVEIKTLGNHSGRIH